jgi:hypothetical protein
MGQCEICGREISGGAQFTCSYCEGTFCPDHRLPFNHACPNIDQWRRSGAPRKRILKKVPVRILPAAITQKNAIALSAVVLFILVVVIATIRPV